MKKIILMFIGLFLFGVAAFAHDGINKEYNLGVKVTPARKNPEYKKGEAMKLFVLLYPLDKNQKNDKYTLKVVRTGDDGKRTENTYPVTLNKKFTYSTQMMQKGFVRIEVFVQDKNGKNIDFVFGGFPRNKAYDGGAGVDFDKLRQMVKEPVDFDAFWAKQKKMIADAPVKYTIKEIESKNPQIDAYYVSVECPNSRPATGILTVPKDKSKKYPAMGLYDGYGCYVQKEALSWVPTDRIVFHLNAHGYEMGREDAYYTEFWKTISGQSGYAFNNEENKNPETAYFYGMALRCMRSLQFLKQHPLFDGTNLTVRGVSQGGMQSIWCAALDHDVKAVSVEVPWCADLGGYTKGRLRGWRPDYQTGLDYFDIVNHAKRIPVTCFTEIARVGLGDYVCPPSGVTIVYNNLKCPKKITYVYDSDHGYVNQGSESFTKENR